MSILHIALDTLDYLEDEMIESGAKSVETRQQLNTTVFQQEGAEGAATNDHVRPLQVQAQAEGRDCHCAFTDSDRHSVPSVTARAAASHAVHLSCTSTLESSSGDQRAGLASNEVVRHLESARTPAELTTAVLAAAADKQHAHTGPTAACGGSGLCWPQTACPRVMASTVPSGIDRACLAHGSICGLGKGAKHTTGLPTKQPDSLVEHPMELTEISRKEEPVRRPEGAVAPANLTPAVLLSANDDHAQRATAPADKMGVHPADEQVSRPNVNLLSADPKFSTVEVDEEQGDERNESGEGVSEGEESTWSEGCDGERAATIVEGDTKADGLLSSAQSVANNESIWASLGTLCVVAAIAMMLLATAMVSEPSEAPVGAGQETNRWSGWAAAVISSAAVGLARVSYTLLAAPTQHKEAQQQGEMDEHSMAQPSRRQINRNETRLRQRKGLMRSKLAHERREVGEKTKETMRTAVIEEQRLNELTRGRQHSRVSQCRGTTRCAGGCRRKIHMQQHMVKRRPEEAGPLISALVVVLSVVQSGDSWIEATVALGVLCAITLIATTMVICTVGALFTGRGKVAYATLAKWRRMGCSCRSMLHVIPSTALCWAGRLVSTAVVPSLPSLIISAAVPMACAVLMSSVGSTATIAAVSAGATMAQQSWNSHAHA